MKEKLKEPKLRFKEFSGEWEEKEFRDVVKLQRGSSPRPIVKYITNDNDGVNWIKIGDVSSKETIIKMTAEKITKEGAKKSRFVKKGEIILSNSMSYGRPYILGIDGYIHDGWFVLRNYEENFNRDYLCFILGSELIQKEYQRLAAGGVVNNISSELVNQVYLNIPSLPEQQKIANFLSKVDEKIEKLTKKKELLEQYKKGVMQKIFSQELRFKDDNGNDFPEWEEKELGELCSLITKGTTPSSVGHQFVNEGINFIKIESITQNGLINISVCPKISIECNEALKRSQLQCNDILFSIAGTLGRVALVKAEHVPANINQALAIIRLLNMKLIPFIKTYLSSQIVSQYIDSYTTVGAQPNINLQQINNIVVPLPSLSEQQKIADFLSTLDKKIDIVDKELEQVQEFKKGLLQQMFV